MGTPRTSPGLAAAARLALARAGEDRAVSHLQSQGYQLLARNLRVGRDEIDILALAPDRRCVVVVEVKLRARSGARAEERIDHAKRLRLVRAAERLATRPEFRGLGFRFDVIAIGGKTPGSELRHWPAAFDAG